MHRRIMVTVMVSVFIALLGVGVILPVLPVLAYQLGASGLAIGLITAIFSLVRGTMQPIVGNLSDRYGGKGFLVLGLLIYGCAGMLFTLANSVSSLLLIRMFQGLGAAMIVPVGMAYASFLAPPGEEGRYMSLINLAIFCGIGCGPIFGGIFADLWGMSSVFYVMAVLCFGAFLLAAYSMPTYQPTGGKQQRRLLASMRLMLKRQRTIGILIARFATTLMMTPTMALLPLIMSQWAGSTALQTGLVIAGRTIVNAALQMPFGRLVDRCNKLWLLLVGCLCMSLALFIIPTMHSFGSMLAIYLFLGFGESMLWPALGAYASEEGRKHFGHGTMMGAFNMAMSAGVFSGAVLSGLVMDYVNMIGAFHGTALAVLLLSGTAILLIHRGERAGEHLPGAVG